jgi:hypothetical protein
VVGIKPGAAEPDALISAWEEKNRSALERSRQVLTQCGVVAIERPWYSCERCHHGWSVVETTLEIGGRTLSLLHPASAEELIEA